MKIFIGGIKLTLLLLGIVFMSLGVHTSELQFFAFGGLCLGLYESLQIDE